MFKRPIVTIILAIGVLTLSSAGKDASKTRRPDFSGMWKLNRSKGSYVIHARLKVHDDLTLQISHTDPEIRVNSKLVKNGKESSQELIYYTDGRGELGHTFVGDIQGKSKTTWQKEKLVTKFSVNVGSGPRVPVDVVQEWKLSRDGNTLTQTQTLRQTNVRTAGGSSMEELVAEEIARVYLQSRADEEITRVFNRVP
jgi:hypothetical protein